MKWHRQTCEDDLAVLARRTRERLQFPTGVEPPLPTLDDLAEVWWLETLHDARQEWSRRHDDVIRGILEVLESEGGPVVQEYMTWISENTVPTETPEGAAEGAFVTAQIEGWKGDAATGLQASHGLWVHAVDSLGITSEDRRLPYPLRPLIEAWLLRNAP